VGTSSRFLFLPLRWRFVLFLHLVNRRASGDTSWLNVHVICIRTSCFARCWDRSTSVASAAAAALSGNPVGTVVQDLYDHVLDLIGCEEERVVWQSEEVPSSHHLVSHVAITVSVVCIIGVLLQRSVDRLYQSYRAGVIVVPKTNVEVGGCIIVLVLLLFTMYTNRSSGTIIFPSSTPCRWSLLLLLLLLLHALLLSPLRLLWGTVRKSLHIGGWWIGAFDVTFHCAICSSERDLGCALAVDNAR